jgi:Glyoxalase-like domain
MATLRDICLDANDPAVVGAFWGAVLEREPADAGEGDGTTPDVVLRENPVSPGPTIWINGVPEPKTGKVRLHLDVDLRPEETVDDLLALGATVLSEPGEVRWWVLADPEGHEFCAFPAELTATNDEDAEVAL